MTTYRLGEQVYFDLAEIERYTRLTYGEIQVDTYMSSIYAGFAKIATHPEIGEIRKSRTLPFLMAPVTDHHYAVYHVEDDAVIFLAVLHGRQNIEEIIRRISPALEKEISKIMARTLEVC